MLFRNAFALSTLSSFATAAYPPDFPVVGNTPDLNLTFGTNNVSPPGELIPRADTLNLPTITSPAWGSANRAVVVIVDTDVPRNGTRVQLLHYLATNVTMESGNRTLILPPAGVAEAPYRQPNPPPGDIPHTYTTLLFLQDRDFIFPEAFKPFLTTRVPFDIAAFVLAAKLGPSIAANYFRVQNTTGVDGTGTGTSTTTLPSASGVAGSGAATMGGGERRWVVGILVGAVAAVGLGVVL